MTVGELRAWLGLFQDKCDCDITDKIIVTNIDGDKYIYSNEGDET